MIINCDKCRKLTILVSTSEVTDEGFIVTINKCSNCGFQKDMDSLFEEFKKLNGETVKGANDWSKLENSGLDTKLKKWDQNDKPDNTNLE